MRIDLFTAFLRTDRRLRNRNGTVARVLQANKIDCPSTLTRAYDDRILLTGRIFARYHRAVAERRRSIRVRWRYSRSSATRPLLPILVAAVVLAAGQSLAGQFTMMTYNVRGLPDYLIEDRQDQIRAIAPLLEDFHTPEAPYVGIPAIVALQELFTDDYYDIITDPLTISYSYVTVKNHGGLSGLGDGLTTLSDFALENYFRKDWRNCNGTFDDGSDCGTDKGYSFARVELEPGVTFDLYTLHADSGHDDGDQAARRGNIFQLVEAIATYSPPDQAVIVAGDTNALFTRSGDNVQELYYGPGLTDVWLELRRDDVVPLRGPDIDSGCAAEPAGADCELVDKILYRDGETLDLTPVAYDVLREMFSDENGDLSDHLPVAATFEYEVLATLPTTSTTSTTTLGARPCGDPVEGDETISTSDALFVLRVAIGSHVSCAECTCDVDDSGEITAADALRVLKKAVGEEMELVCPACG